jgi:2-keto-4-pentenoate hydratase
MDDFPTEDVMASLNDDALQKEHSLEAYLEQADPGKLAEARGIWQAEVDAAIADGGSQETRWIYFRSPPWTWEQLCGREGWLLVDPRTGRQFQFLMTAMN